MYVGENESVKFWATVLNSLKNRCVKGIFIACTDSFMEFDMVIHTVFLQEVQQPIYTTNTIEGFNRQLLKVNMSKSIFTTDDSLLKILYLTMIDITQNRPDGSTTEV